MKKFFALILALAVMASLSVPAFAVTLDAKGSQTIDVMGTYTLGAVSTTYSVDITWENMVFAYTANAKWDAENYENVDAGTGGTWDGTGTVTVVNNSNASVNVDMSFAGTETSAENRIEKNIIGNLKKDDAAYETTEVASKGGTVVATLTITGGALKAKTEGQVNIGTITVTLS